MISKMKINSIVMSILLHMLIASFFIITFKHSLHYRVPGVKKPVVAYLVHTHDQLQHKISTPTDGKNKVHMLISPGGHYQQVKKKKQQQKNILSKSHLAKNKQLTGKKLNQLVVLIYKAISQHKVYPSMAQSLGQTGRVLISFKLTLQGAFSNIEIVKSSGYRDLDKAALSAVRRAGSIVGAQRYISKSQVFVIPVDFQS